MAKFRILSVDGGGIRGVITAIMVERLCQEAGLADWHQKAHLFAGTSTGGLLALGFAAGLTPTEMRDLYEKRGPKIFDDSFWDNVVDLGKWVGADYNIRNLRKEVHKVLGNKTLKDLLPKHVLITAFDLDNEAQNPAQRTWKPKLFHNVPGPGNDGAQPAWKVGVYTSAAPTFFASEDGYIDGGVYAPNPSMCALAQALDGSGLAKQLDEIVLLSLGTGLSLRFIKGPVHNWGKAQWAEPIVSLMFDGVSGIADYQCRQLLGSRYHRLAPAFPPGTTFEMDDVEKIPQMIALAQRVPIQDTAKWIAAEWLP